MIITHRYLKDTYGLYVPILTVNMYGQLHIVIYDEEGVHWPSGVNSLDVDTFSSFKNNSGAWDDPWDVMTTVLDYFEDKPISANLCTCICDLYTQLLPYGCNCEAGKEELFRERNSLNKG